MSPALLVVTQGRAAWHMTTMRIIVRQDCHFQPCHFRRSLLGRQDDPRFQKKKVDLQMILPGQKNEEKNKKKASRNKTTQNRDVV